MAQAAWDTFFRRKVEKIFQDKKIVIDIGAGLRVSKEKGNRYDPARAWIQPLLRDVDYKVLDPVPDYNPDIVGDIEKLELLDNSQEAIICLAVLEHVENPVKAVMEMHRVLQPGGYCLVYIPFLYYYHAEKGYYQDYWRFSKDAVDSLFKIFSQTEKQSVRGALETWLHISPLGKFKLLVMLFRWLDTILKKTNSNQVSGYYVFAVK